MKAAHFPRIMFANRRSIRWRLPWSYAGIALLTALALGGLLLFTLNRHYTRLETQYLEMSARGLARQIDTMNRDGMAVQDIQSVVNLFSILTRARVQLYDTERMLVADSGPASDRVQINFGFGERVSGQVGGADDAARSSGPFVITRPDAVSISTDSPQTSMVIQGEPGTLTTITEGLPVEGTPGAVASQATLVAGSIAVAGSGSATQPLTITTGSAPGADAPPGEGAGDQFAGRYLVPLQRGPMGQISFESVAEGSVSSAHINVPVYDVSGTLLAYLELSEGPAFGSEIVKAVAENSLVAGTVALLFAGMLGILMSRNISKPVLSLAEVAREMEQGNLAIRSGVKRRDEFGTLAETFNAMASQIETTVATLRQFVADAAHEINTPLTALRTNLELTATSEIPGAARADVEKALAELSRLDALTSNLLMLTRLENPLANSQRAPVDLTGLLRQMHERYASRAEQAAIDLSVEVPADPVILQADASQITRVMNNLLDNALKFTPDGGQITLGLAANSAQARLWVQDTGIGIPAGDLPKLFSRFHRGRNTAAFPGNGLGLSIVKAIVDDHGGHIEVSTGEDGTCFTVSLPLVQRTVKNKERES